MFNKLPGLKKKNVLCIIPRTTTFESADSKPNIELGLSRDPYGVGWGGGGLETENHVLLAF